MPVYLIRAGKHGPVKIGKADDVEERRANLQVAHWEQLTVLKVWEGGEAEESALHLRFADLHIRGEWFAFSRQMLGDVGLVEVSAEQSAPTSELTAKNIIRLLGGPSVLGQSLQMGTSRVCNWGREGIPGKHWQRIADIAKTSPETAHITLASLAVHSCEAA